MDDGARRWLLNTARANFWRVSRWYDLDDLIQEGCEVYYYVLNRYAKAKDPPHIMCLFKLSFMSRLHDLANQRTRRPEDVCDADLGFDDGSGTASFFDGVTADTDVREAAAALATAPQYVKDAMALFSTEDGLRRLRSQYRRVPTGGRRTRRETLNERFCRLTGNDPRSTDIVGALRACLTGD
jgi:hypothetical protein